MMMMGAIGWMDEVECWWDCGDRRYLEMLPGYRAYGLLAYVIHTCLSRAPPFHSRALV